MALDIVVPTLSRTRVRVIAKELRAKGRKLPRVGVCQRLEDGRDLCHDQRGYYLVGATKKEWAAMEAKLR